jgi:hypothetical protein
MIPHGFTNEISLLEDYLSDVSMSAAIARWGGLTGKGLKTHQRFGARSAADEFVRSPKSEGNRAHLRITLEGSGVHAAVAKDIATNA